ncbi:MAG TPA: hypothetical protein VIL84_11995 [Devosiaceae bacterium]
MYLDHERDHYGRLAALDQNAFRSLVVFLAVPVAITVAITLWVQFTELVFPHPAQAQTWNIAVVAPILALGAVGAWLSVHSHMTPDPLARRYLLPGLVASLVAGVLVGSATLFLDQHFGFSAFAARKLGVSTLAMSFPISVPINVGGAIVLECLFRLIPLSVIYWLIGRVVLHGRHEHVVFWSIAAITALLEPLGNLPGIAGGQPMLWAVIAVIYGANLVEAALFRRYGWPAPIMARIAMFGAWHVLGGILIAAAR